MFKFTALVTAFEVVTLPRNKVSPERLVDLSFDMKRRGSDEGEAEWRDYCHIAG